ncbi:MAG: UPF0182 family protein [bacterium]|nr:UPF0182 family protein [bacterium]
MTRKFWIPTVFVVVVGIGWSMSYYTDWLWFVSMDYQSVFWRTLKARFMTGVIFGLLAAVVVGVNLWVAGKFTRSALETGESPFEGGIPGVGLLRTKVGYFLVGAVLVMILGNIGSAQWPVLLRYVHAQSFGVADPIFNRDVGFYVFSLPIYQFTVNFLMGVVVVSALAVGFIYLIAGGIRIQERIQIMPQPLAHLSGLGGVFMLVMAWNYRLKIYELLYHAGGRVFGAGYVDVNVQIWTYWTLVVVFLGTAGLLLKNIQDRTTRLPLIGAGLLVGGAVVVGSVPAALVQRIYVDPTELEVEAPYLKNNIEATRRAYGLDRIEEQPFEASENLTRTDIEANPVTIRNVRIWDERPMVQTYQQLQEIRPYYVFPSVDVDRYTIDGVYRQVMLSAREMATDRLLPQTQSWQNTRLVYTHGYGVAMSPVNVVTPQGLPSFMIKDIPPVSEFGFKIDRPEIYYGERSHAYVLVKTSAKEFDYPAGDENQYTVYQGTGGVPMGSFLKRLAFTIRFMDFNFLLSSYLQPETRIMFRRQIVERVRTIAPFLSYDSDPYLVVSEGRLYWILDAYTTTNMYPYSERSGRSRINYIRNSVKVVVDAYHGKATFYLADEEPIIKAYVEIFPDLFKPIENMPEDLRAHVRYPVDLFRIQAAQYREYHMQDIQVFYNQEDLWEIPNEIYSDRPQRMGPYYIIVKLPGEQREEFLLMVPFTPAKKDNMIGWLAARCDGDSYGDLLVYKLPKDKLIFGPMQLEARIDQQPEISSRLTLWGQRGSEVIRGNLLAIPIESSFLYVEPIYLQARQEPDEQPQFNDEEGGGQRQAPRRPQIASTAIPELKQVIVAFGGQVIMRDTFEDALNDLFGMRTTAAVEAARSAQNLMPETAAQTATRLAGQAEAHYQTVRKSLQEWDWAKAGEAMQALERSITELKKVLEEEK